MSQRPRRAKAGQNSHLFFDNDVSPPSCPALDQSHTKGGKQARPRADLKKHPVKRTKGSAGNAGVPPSVDVCDLADEVNMALESHHADPLLIPVASGGLLSEYGMQPGSRSQPQFDFDFTVAPDNDPSDGGAGAGLTATEPVLEDDLQPMQSDHNRTRPDLLESWSCPVQGCTFTGTLSAKAAHMAKHKREDQQEEVLREAYNPKELRVTVYAMSSGAMATWKSKRVTLATMQAGRFSLDVFRRVLNAVKDSDEPGGVFEQSDPASIKYRRSLKTAEFPNVDDTDHFNEVIARQMVGQRKELLAGAEPHIIFYVGLLPTRKNPGGCDRKRTKGEIVADAARAASKPLGGASATVTEEAASKAVMCQHHKTCILDIWRDRFQNHHLLNMFASQWSTMLGYKAHELGHTDDMYEIPPAKIVSSFLARAGKKAPSGEVTDPKAVEALQVLLARLSTVRPGSGSGNSAPLSAVAVPSQPTPAAASPGCSAASHGLPPASGLGLPSPSLGLPSIPLGLPPATTDSEVEVMKRMSSEPTHFTTQWVRTMTKDGLGNVSAGNIPLNTLVTVLGRDRKRATTDRLEGEPDQWYTPVGYLDSVRKFVTFWVEKEKLKCVRDSVGIDQLPPPPEGVRFSGVCVSKGIDYEGSGEGGDEV